MITLKLWIHYLVIMPDSPYLDRFKKNPFLKNFKLDNTLWLCLSHLGIISHFGAIWLRGLLVFKLLRARRQNYLKETIVVLLY